MTTIITFIMFSALLLVQFIAGGTLLSLISGFSYQISVLIMGSIILLYLLLGGFKAVVKTDLFQFFIMVLLGFVLVLSFNSNLTIDSTQYNLFAVGMDQIIAFVILGMLVLLISADVWQRAYSAKNQKTLKYGFYLAGIVLAIFGLTVSIIGIVTKNQFPNIASQEALYYGFAYLLPKSILGLGLIFILASLMSTADTSAFITAMNISNDFIAKFKKLSKTALVRITRFSIISLVIIAVLIALFVQNILDVVFAVVTIGISMSPAIVGSFKWKLKRKAVLYSLVSGLLSAIILIFAGFITPETSIVSFPVALIVLIFGQLFFKENQ